MRHVVFVDFDGTITDVDTFDVLVRRFGGDGPWHEIEGRLDRGEMTLAQALQEEAGYVRISLDEADALLQREVRFEPTFAAFVARCDAEGVPVTVVSSGVEPLIARALARQGLQRVPIIANGLEVGPAGWRLVFADADGNGTDKAGLVRRAQAAGTSVTFIGDGRSDYDAARVADRTIARRGSRLDRYLAERGLPYDRFTTFDDVAVP